MKRLTLDIPDELHRAIKDKADLEGKAMTEICKCNFTETQKFTVLYGYLGV